MQRKHRQFRPVNMLFDPFTPNSGPTTTFTKKFKFLFVKFHAQKLREKGFVQMVLIIPKFFFRPFEPQFDLKRSGGSPRAPPMDPSLNGTYWVVREAK